MDTEHKNSFCPVCKRQGAISSIQAYRNFVLWECSQCKVQFWQPFQSMGAGWYEKDSRYTAQGAVKPKLERAYHRKFLELHGSELQGKKLLDIGCGTGEFLAALQEKGVDVWGIDFDHSAIEAARKHFHLQNVYAVSSEQFAKENQSMLFDYVCAFEVVQYSDNSVAFLERVRLFMKPEGMAVISVPSRNRLFANWHRWDLPPNHLTRWNEKSIENVASFAGLTVVAIYHLEQFKMLVEAMNSRLRFGATQKVQGVVGGEAKGSFVVKGVILAAKVKEYILGFVPACLLWPLAKMQGRDKGTLMVEMKRNI